MTAPASLTGHSSFTGKPEDKATLLRVLFHSLAAPFFAATIPRLAIVIFQYAQPLLISQSIEFLSETHSSSESKLGYLLVYCAIAVYFGLAVSHQSLTDMVQCGCG